MRTKIFYAHANLYKLKKKKKRKCIFFIIRVQKAYERAKEILYLDYAIKIWYTLIYFPQTTYRPRRGLNRPHINSKIS